MGRVVKLAGGLGSDVRLVVHDQTGQWRLVAQPDGQLREDDLEPSASYDLPAHPTPPPMPWQSSPLQARPVATVTPLTIPAPAPATAGQERSKAVMGEAVMGEIVEKDLPRGGATRASFIISERRERAATNGWGGVD